MEVSPGEAYRLKSGGACGDRMESVYASCESQLLVSESETEYVSELIDAEPRDDRRCHPRQDRTVSWI